MVSTDVLGGVWYYTLDLVRCWSDAGIEVVLAVLGPPPGDAQRREAAAVPGLTLHVTGLPLDWTAPDRASLEHAASALAALAATSDVGSVHLHAPALFGATAWPVPTVVVAHSCLRTWWLALRSGGLPDALAWQDDMAASGLARADAVVAPSRSFATDLTRAYGLARPVRVIGNGRSPQPVAAATARHGVLACGRAWDEAKDFATLDRAARMVSAPVRLAGALAGPNAERALPLTAVHTLGSLDPPALARERARASVFVSCSRFEPFGLAVLEAAQAGLALVLSDLPTFRELWQDAALFFPVGDASALARALDQALAEPEALAGKALARAAAYTAEAMAAETASLHRALTDAA